MPGYKQNTRKTGFCVLVKLFFKKTCIKAFKLKIFLIIK